MLDINTLRIMRKSLYIVLAAAVALFASCSQDVPDNPGSSKHPAVIKANYTELSNGAITGEEVKTLPVSASSADGTLDLKFFTDKIYLPAGTYTLGKEIGNYTGHFQNDWVDADIVGGMITVGLEGDEDYSVSGTVRLGNEEGTALKIRSNGKMVYEFPTEYYYTVTKGANVHGVTADVYKVYDMNTSVQLAECAIVGGESGTFDILEGTAVYGTPNDGCWFFEPGFGTHIMIHGSVATSKSHGKMNFAFNDTKSASFTNCELKQDITPALPASSGDISFMMFNFFSVESPVAEGMYELTIKMNYTDGGEFMSLTALCPTPNPLLEALKKDGDSTGGMPFQAVTYEEYLQKPTSRCGIEPTIFYVVNGVKYPVKIEDGFAMVTNGQMAGGAIAALLAPTNMAYALPGPLDSYLTGIGGSIWSLIGYYFPQ